MVVVTSLLAGLVAVSGGVPVAADVAPPALPPSGTGRYVVELEAGAVAVGVKPDHPNVDGLAGGAPAATRGNPMVMAPPAGSMPNGIGLALAQLRPQRVVVLGGTAAIVRDIENAVATYLL